MEEETEYVLIGTDNYGATLVRREVTREKLEKEIMDFCEIENVHYRDVTICEVVPADITISVGLSTD